ncbi:TPA: hypothetical protein NJ423_004548 [Vibrio parahaemolyticus]|nr:hypothetical protein [Vibrio parahaemolyticus]
MIPDWANQVMKVDEVQDHHLKHETDLHTSVTALDAEVFTLKFPFGVASAAG